MITISNREWTLDNIKGIIFDKDGTLIDSHTYWGRIIQRRALSIMKYYQLEDGFFPDLCLSMGYSLGNERLVQEGPIALVSRDEVIQILNDFLLTRGAPSSKNDLDRLLLEEHEAFMAEIFSFIKIIPGVKEFLQSVKGLSVKTAVVTADSVKNTAETLRYLEIDAFFDAVIGKESTKEPKTTGIPAVKALQLMGLRREEVVCIGDAPMDLIMARNSGLKAGIGVVTGQIGYHVLSRYSPFIAMSLRDLTVSKYNAGCAL